MTPVQIVVIPVPVCGQTWSKRTPPPQYPRKRDETWPLRQSIPQEDARRQLDDVRRRIASERDKLRELAREGQRA
jgi:hypothetical protein